MTKNKLYLLDTQVLLWWLSDNKRLTPKIKKIIHNPNNLILYSTASIWEISIKRNIGKLTLKVSLKKLINSIPFQVLPIKNQHILKLDKLPAIHKDPFDRILIAQAKTEKAVLITADAKISKYKLPTLYP